MVDRTWKREYRGANFEKYTFLGIFRCGYCGCVMRIHKYSKSLYGYVCNNATHTDIYNCTHRNTYRVQHIETDAIKLIKDLVEKQTDFSEVDRDSVSEKVKVSQKKTLEERLRRLNDNVDGGYYTLEEALPKKKEILEALAKLDTKPEIKSIPINDLWDKFITADTPTAKRNILKTFIQRIEVRKDGLQVVMLQN